MEDRLVPVNALIGLVSSRHDVNPSTLRDAGYELAGLEVPVTGPLGTVTVDALLFHPADTHLVMCEVKSGANVDEGQARRYSAIDPANVVDAGHVTLARREQPTVEVLYVGIERWQDRLEQGFAALGYGCPMLIVGSRQIAMRRADLASDRLRSAFKEPTRLTGPPAALIPFDHDSPVDQVRPAVQAEMMAVLSLRTPQMTVSTLTERIAKFCGIYGRKAKNELVRKVGEAAQAVAASEPDTFGFRRRTANRDALVTFLRSPEEYDPRGRTSAYQALAGRRRPPRVPRVDPNQMDLLSELGQEDDGGDGEDPGTEEDGR